MCVFNPEDGHADILKVAPVLPIHRCRPLPTLPVPGGKISLALNGRKGRRVGCVSMGEGKQVEVFDMEEDEDAQEGGEGDSADMEGVEEE
jgi:hypothetical protein